MKFYAIIESEKLDMPVSFSIYDTDKNTEIEALSREQDHIENLDMDFITNTLILVAGDCKPKIVNEDDYIEAIEKIKAIAIKANENALTFA